MEVQPSVGNIAVVDSDEKSEFLVPSLYSQFVAHC